MGRCWRGDEGDLEVEPTNEHVWLVGLSATLPDYQDVGTFMCVDETKGLFYFVSYYVLRSPTAIHRHHGEEGHQVAPCHGQGLLRESSPALLHFRKEVSKRAKLLRDLAGDDGPVRQTGWCDMRKQSRTATSRTSSLWLHHSSRVSSVRLSKTSSLKATSRLSFTATLARGVKLPASTVIIERTHIYSAEKGRWVEGSSCRCWAVLAVLCLIRMVKMCSWRVTRRCRSSSVCSASSFQSRVSSRPS